jgi:hypothetical protein
MGCFFALELLRYPWAVFYQGLRRKEAMSLRVQRLRILRRRMKQQDCLCSKGGMARMPNIR